MEEQPLVKPQGEHHTNAFGVGRPITVLVILLVLLGFFIWFFGGGLSEDRGDVIEGLPEDQRIVRTEPGTIVENFPDELLIVLDSAEFVNGVYEFTYRELAPEDIVVSFSINSAPSADKTFEKPTVQYMSGGTLAQNIAAFDALLADSGWEIAIPADPGAEARTSLYAIRGNESLNVTFLVAEDGSVTINSAYLLETIEEQSETSVVPEGEIPQKEEIE